MRVTANVCNNCLPISRKCPTWQNIQPFFLVNNAFYFANRFFFLFSSKYITDFARKMRQGRKRREIRERGRGRTEKSERKREGGREEEEREGGREEGRKSIK